MNCIIVDDEPLACEGLQALIDKHPSLQLAKIFHRTEGVSSFIEENDIDLVFLDIEMPAQTGLEFARLLPEHTLIIFTTAYPQYALDSYEVEAIDYLVKPISEARFERALAKAEQYAGLLAGAKNSVEQVEANHILVRADRRFIQIPFGSILFISGLKDYVIIHTTTSKVITLMNVKTIHSKLPPATFVRVSKSHIVNKDKIQMFDNTAVHIADQEIPIGKTYRTDFFNLYKKSR